MVCHDVTYKWKLFVSCWGAHSKRSHLVLMYCTVCPICFFIWSYGCILIIVSRHHSNLVGITDLCLHLLPLDMVEFHISVPLLSTTRTPSSRKNKRFCLHGHEALEAVCQQGLSAFVYMTKLQSSCITRRCASLQPWDSEVQIGFQP